MKKINTHNYEAYFLDYTEGNLNESQIRELKKFLNANPKLKEELHDFEEFTLKPENIIYNQKEELIKNTQAKHFEINNFEYLCIADIENDITKEDKTLLKNKLDENTNRIKDFNLFKKTKLSPDLNIRFPKKKQLTRRYLPAGVKAVTSVAAAITATLLVLNMSGLFHKPINQSGKQLISKIKSKEYKIISKQEISENTNMQETLISHNQTIKQTNNNDLAFVDNEPQNKENMYKELTVSIPDIKNEALIFSGYKDNMINSKTNFEQSNINQNTKEALWPYAEAGVNVWKSISSSEMEMNNTYH